MLCMQKKKKTRQQSWNQTPKSSLWCEKIAKPNRKQKICFLEDWLQGESYNNNK